MRDRKRLSAGEFEALLPHITRMEERNINAVRQILVYGRKQKELVAALRISKEAVSNMVSKVWQLHLEHSGRPDGWVNVNVTLPSDLAEVVVGMEKIALSKAKAIQ